MLGRQPVTMEIVSEACCHIYMPQLVLLYGRSCIFWNNDNDNDNICGGHCRLPSTLPYQLTQSWQQSSRVRIILFILIYLFPESFHNMNYYHSLPRHRWGVCTAQGHTALRDKVWSQGDQSSGHAEGPGVTLDMSHRVSRVHFFSHAIGRLPFQDFCQG